MDNGFEPGQEAVPASVVHAGWRYPPLIINAALTGNIPTKNDSHHVPTSPEEIARDALECFRNGARVVHLHARDDDGQATWQPSIFEDTIGRIRELCPELIICASTSGRNFQEIEKRAAVLMLRGALRPDMASLSLGSFNFPKQPSVNAPSVIAELATTMRQQGIRPELEVFDLGMIDYGRYLIERKLLEPPFYFNLFLGSLGTLSATPANLAAMVNALPQNAIWSAAGVGRYQYYVNNMAIAMQGNIRVGLEDNIWFDAQRTKHASNSEFVGRVAGIAEVMGRRLATPAEAREILGIAAAS